MAGNPFTYPSYDLLNGDLIDALPYQGVNFGAPLNQPGSWAGQLALADQRVQSLDWNHATRPSCTAVFVDLLGTLVWGGIMWTRRYRESTKILQLGAMEFGSYFRQRLQAFDYSTTWAAGADPMFIVQQIVSDALGVGNVMGSPGITLILNPAGGEGGPTSTPSYPGTSLQTIDSMVSILSQMGYTFGFDYSFDCAYVPGTRTPAIRMNLWYPRQGRTAAQSQITILAKQCVDWTWDEDGTQQATSVSETGSGTGGVQPATVSETLAGYPLLERAISRTQVNDEATLANIAIGDLGLYAYPVVTPSFILPVALPDASGRIDPSALTFGQFDRGDNFIFRVDPVAGGGDNISPRFPTGCEFEFRINQWLCTVPDHGLATLQLDAGVPPIQVIPPPQAPL